MKTYALCPISNKRIDERVARFNGFFTVLFLLAFTFTSNILFILFLSIDFLLRSTDNAKYSLLAIISKWLVNLFSLKPILINAGPKIFAARIGFVFTISIIASSLLEFNTAAYIFTAIFGTCAILEAAIGFCVACEIYPFVYKLFYQSKIELTKNK